MPWLNIPKDRETVFVEPRQIRGGLLGGASQTGKMSKLQALAAARKKKADDQRSGDKQVSEATQKLNNLSTSPSKQPEFVKENVPPSSIDPKKATYSTGPGTTNTSQLFGSKCSDVGGNPIRSQLQDTTDRPVDSLAPTNTPPVAAPSAFAQALLGSSNSSTAPVKKNFPFPYFSLTSSVADAFAAPSPDDVVLAAQSQGSLSARKTIK